MFEPIHGSAFDIMGKGLANPVGTFWSVVMLLEHLGETEAAQRVMSAIEQVTAEPGAAHPRSRRQGDDRRGDAGGLRPGRRGGAAPGRLTPPGLPDGAAPPFHPRGRASRLPRACQACGEPRAVSAQAHSRR